jgi:hypothetical protein
MCQKICKIKEITKIYQQVYNHTGKKIITNLCLVISSHYARLLFRKIADKARAMTQHGIGTTLELVERYKTPYADYYGTLLHTCRIGMLTMK